MGPSLRQAGFSKRQQEVVASEGLSWQEQGQGKRRLDLQWKEETCQGLSVQVQKLKVSAKLSKPRQPRQVSAGHPGRDGASVAGRPGTRAQDTVGTPNRSGLSVRGQKAPRSPRRPRRDAALLLGNVQLPQTLQHAVAAHHVWRAGTHFPQGL
eukprot:3446146-Amphidinium_carterae.1